MAAIWVTKCVDNSQKLKDNDWGSLLSGSKSSVANNYPDPRVNRGLRSGLRVDPTNFKSPNGSTRVDHFSWPDPRVDPGFRNWVPALIIAKEKAIEDCW